jgi:hypothetical protein
LKGIKLSDYFKIVKPEYVVLKLTPNNSVRNNSTHRIAKATASLYKSIWQQIKVEDAKLIKVLGKEFMMGTKYSLQLGAKVSYFIYIEKSCVGFYFIVPMYSLSILKEKIRDSWKNITIEQVDALPEFRPEATKYQMVYSKEDGLSLTTDRRDNELLHSNLNIVDVLEDGDKVGIFYNFIPTTQFTWRATFRNTLQKVKDGTPTERNKIGVSFWFKTAVAFIGSISNALSDITKDSGSKGLDASSVSLSAMEKAIERMNRSLVSNATHKKGTDTVLNTQILVISESQDKLRQRNNAKSLAQSFDTLTEDNSLIAKSYTQPFNPLAFSIPKAEVNKVSAEECQNFIALPGREILERYNFIDKVDTQETEVPEELCQGVMSIGENTFRGAKQKAYLSTDKEYQQLTLVLIGPTRAGKTTLIGNLANDALNNGECVIMFDFIENCELSTEVASLFPQTNVLNIQCSDFSALQGLGYNEVGISSDVFTKYDNAKKQSTQLLTLINSINTNDKTLAPRMERFLTSAALITFIQGGSVMDVFNVLVDHRRRCDFIQGVPSNQLDNLSEYIMSLEELDETSVDKQTKELSVIGTKFTYITGIIDRVQKLKSNTYMELMLKSGTQNNVNLVEEIQKPHVICIQMPESMFSTDTERDVYCTYWMTKLWLSLQLRSDRIRDKDARTKVNLVIDELYQVRNTEEFLTEKLSRFAKFRLKPIISCHYMNQINIIRDELRSANASYMLISGCDKQNYNELKDELYPYQLEDLLNLPRYHSMNLIKSKGGYAKFITKLPKPILQKIDNTQAAK